MSGLQQGGVLVAMSTEALRQGGVDLLVGLVVNLGGVAQMQRGGGSVGMCAALCLPRAEKNTTCLRPDKCRGGARCWACNALVLKALLVRYRLKRLHRPMCRSLRRLQHRCVPTRQRLPLRTRKC